MRSPSWSSLRSGVQGQHVVALIDGHRGQPAQRVGGLRMARRGLREGGFRRFQIAHAPLRDAQIHQRFQPIGPFAHADAERLDTARRVFAQQAQIADAEPCLLALRIHFHQLLDAFFGFGRIAQTILHHGQVPEGGRDCRAQAAAPARRLCALRADRRAPAASRPDWHTPVHCRASASSASA